MAGTSADAQQRPPPQARSLTDQVTMAKPWRAALAQRTSAGMSKSQQGPNSARLSPVLSAFGTGSPSCRERDGEDRCAFTSQLSE
jgi:hypothetical protein